MIGQPTRIISLRRNSAVPEWEWCIARDQLLNRDVTFQRLLAKIKKETESYRREFDKT
jgi:hypothetical protein